MSDCFTIDEYTCPLLDQFQKMLEQDFYIDVGIASTIQPIPNTSILPTTWFRFLPKKQILELGENPPYCPGMSSNLESLVMQIYFFCYVYYHHF